jgi:hypothetical protein
MSPNVVSVPVAPAPAVFELKKALPEIKYLKLVLIKGPTFSQ